MTLRCRLRATFLALQVLGNFLAYGMIPPLKTVIQADLGKITQHVYVMKTRITWEEKFVALTENLSSRAFEEELRWSPVAHRMQARAVVSDSGTCLMEYNTQLPSSAMSLRPLLWGTDVAMAYHALERWGVFLTNLPNMESARLERQAGGQILWLFSGLTSTGLSLSFIKDQFVLKHIKNFYMHHELYDIEIVHYFPQFIPKTLHITRKSNSKMLKLSVIDMKILGAQHRAHPVKACSYPPVGEYYQASKFFYELFR